MIFASDDSRLPGADTTTTPRRGSASTIAFTLRIWVELARLVPPNFAAILLMGARVGTLGARWPVGQLRGPTGAEIA